MTNWDVAEGALRRRALSAVLSKDATAVSCGHVRGIEAKCKRGFLWTPALRSRARKQYDACEGAKDS